MEPETGAADSGFDISSAVGDIASGLGFSDAPDDAGDSGSDGAESSVAAAGETQSSVTSPAKETGPAAAPTTPAPTVREPPKSWSKDKHELWSKLPPEAQDYYEQREKQMLDGLEQYKGDATHGKTFKDLTAPYAALLKSQGLSEQQAVQYLLNAHFRLTNGTLEQRRAAYEQLGKGLQILPSQTTAQAPGQSAAALPPEVQTLQSRLDALEFERRQEAETQMRALRADADKQIESFAANPANVYFQEVAQDMVPLIKAGMTLEAAYERCVWGNPVTRAKEQLRAQTEWETNFKAKSKAEADAARKATAANVRSADTPKTPTGRKGKFLDTASMLDDLKEIQSR